MMTILRSAHEALVREWDYVKGLIVRHRGFLEQRVRLQAAAERWQGDGRKRDHLLPSGLLLEEGRTALADMPDGLTVETRQLIEESLRQARKRQLRVQVGAMVFAVVAVAASAGAVVAWKQMQRAEVAEQEAVQKRDLVSQSAAEMRRQAAVADCDLAAERIQVDRWADAAALYARAQERDPSNDRAVLEWNQSVGSQPFGLVHGPLIGNGWG